MTLSHSLLPLKNIFKFSLKIAFNFLKSNLKSLGKYYIIQYSEFQKLMEDPIMKKLITVCMILSLTLLGVVNSGCNKNSVMDANQIQAEKTGAFLATSFIYTVNVLVPAVLALVVGYNLNGSGIITYNATTGWWSLELSLSTGESFSVMAQFMDVNGTHHKFINLNTHSFATKIDAVWSVGSFGVNITFTGINLSSNVLTVNGTGTVTFLGETSGFSANNLKIRKFFSIFPLGGTMTVSVGGISLSITYDGTQYAIVTYSHNGDSFTFTINLIDGTIHPSPQTSPKG